MKQKYDMPVKFPRFFFILAFASLTPFLFSCKNDPVPVNDQEIITKLTIHVQEIDPLGSPIGTPLAFSWMDQDGDGGNDPVVDTIILKVATRYEATLEVLNESLVPAVDITEEILAEGPSHQFFFLVDAPANVTFQYADNDSNQQPIGIKTTVQTGTESAGKVTIILRHLPEKSAAGVSAGDITHAGGETDFESVPPFELKILP